MLACAVVAALSLLTLAVCAVLCCVYQYKRAKAMRTAYKPATRDEKAMVGQMDGWTKLT